MPHRLVPKPYDRYIPDTDIGIDSSLAEKLGLPIEDTQRKESFFDYTTLLHGVPKIGKSTFCSLLTFDGKSPLFFCFEEGLKGIATKKLSIQSWDTLKIYLMHLWKLYKHKPKEFPFNLFVMDTVDLMFKMCHDFISRKHSITHASDLEYGKGWEFLLDEFTRILTFVQKFQIGIILISHSREVEFKTRTLTINKWQPTLTGTGRRIILPAVDIIGFCNYDHPENLPEAEKFKARRIIHWSPTEEWEAGDRSGFLPTKTLLKPPSVLKHFPGNKEVCAWIQANKGYREKMALLK